MEPEPHFALIEPASAAAELRATGAIPHKPLSNSSFAPIPQP
ncbi:hypothetical protein [Nocardia sp. NPDC059239]